MFIHLFNFRTCIILVRVTVDPGIHPGWYVGPSQGTTHVFTPRAN